MDSGMSLSDFSAVKTTHHQFTRKLGVNFSPTVLLLNDNGAALTEPLEGVLTLDYYRYYFEKPTGS